MVFDGASNALGNEIGVVIISPEGCHTPFTARLCFDCTNNMAEYEACILGLKAAIGYISRTVGERTIGNYNLKGNYISLTVGEGTIGNYNLKRNYHLTHRRRGNPREL